MNSQSEKHSENATAGTELLGPEIWNLPNTITVSRLVLSLMLFVMIYLEGWWKTSALLFIIAAATDFLDGYFARKYNQVTTLGRILDPFVDKIIICGAFIFLLGTWALYWNQCLVRTDHYWSRNVYHQSARLSGTTRT